MTRMRLATALLALALAGIAADEAPPLTVRDGVLLRDGAPYHAIGANYFTLFARLLADPADTSQLDGLAALGRAGVPFVRFMACGFWPVDQALYARDRAEYFRRFDLVVRAAERAGVGLVPSLFWMTSTASDVVGEHLDAMADPASATIARIKAYTTDVVTRYRSSRAIWAWEFGNEGNLWCDLPDAGRWRAECWPQLGTPAARTARDDLTWDQLRGAYAAFAETARALDPLRPVVTGNAMPRASAWHNVHERTWTADDATQFAEILRRDNPDPFAFVTVHIYPEAANAYAGGARTIGDAIALAAKAAAEAGKPLFLGEFGVERAAGDAARARFGEFVEAIVANRVPLSAFWVFDHPGMEKDWNVSFANDRAWQIDAIVEANRRLAAAR